MTNTTSDFLIIRVAFNIIIPYNGISWGENVERLKELRIKNKYTHKAMAELLNISKPYYWQIENSKRGLSYEMAYRIAKIFNKKPDEIFYNYFDNKINSKTKS